MPAPRVDEYFVVRGGVLTVADEHRTKVLESPALLVTAVRLGAIARKLTIVPPLLEDIHRHVDTVLGGGLSTPEVSRTFLAILARARH